MHMDGLVMLEKKLHDSQLHNSAKLLYEKLLCVFVILMPGVHFNYNAVLCGICRLMVLKMIVY